MKLQMRLRNVISIKFDVPQIQKITGYIKRNIDLARTILLVINVNEVSWKNSVYAQAKQKSRC